MSRQDHLPPIHARTYGDTGPVVVLLHGGPGAPGYMAPVARELARTFQVLEPLQRRSGDIRLTVARHVEDLHVVLTAHAAETRPAIVGHSWGAMLALAYAAKYPGSPSCLALIGCGTFDDRSRDQLNATRQERMTERLHKAMTRIGQNMEDRDDRLRALGRLYQRLDSYDLAPAPDELLPYDARGHEETWQDMLRLQRERMYPAAFAAVKSPAIMVHGDHDPHPGQMIYGSLFPALPQIEFQQLPQCGHYPWLERAARDTFYTTLTKWLVRNLG